MEKFPKPVNEKGKYQHQVFIDTNFKKHIISLVEHFMTNRIIVQGEFIGKPQGNKLQVDNQIRLFNIYVNGQRLSQNDFYDVCNKYGIPCCPLIIVTTMHFSLPEILEFAQGKSLLNKNVEREGIVCRCIEDHLSFKVISNKWLLLNNE